MKKLHKESLTDAIAATHLGKKSETCVLYAPELLVAVPREENRTRYEIDKNDLPFVGFDVWHAFEFSSMTENGVPVSRVLKLKYPCDNDFIVESKSLKLYLNSFNMSRFGATTGECLTICKSLIEKDLSEKLQTEVEVNFLETNSERVGIYDNFVPLMSSVDETNLKITKFNEAPEELKIIQGSAVCEYRLTFDSLRSNCRVTHQPDFGDAFIYYKSDKRIDEASLVRYLVSFRSEYHFHEECCEMIYKRLYDILGAEAELFVSCLYTRRGGIDICPVRKSKNCSISEEELLTDLTKYAAYGIKR